MGALPTRTGKEWLMKRLAFVATLALLAPILPAAAAAAAPALPAAAAAAAPALPAAAAIAATGGGFSAAAAAVAAAGDGSPTDPNIAFVGRWDTSNAAGYVPAWAGAYLSTGFTGT